MVGDNPPDSKISQQVINIFLYLFNAISIQKLATNKSNS